MKHTNTYKLMILVSAITLIITSLARAQDLTNGLIAYYPFNGNANDESGNGHDGVVHGAILIPDRCGNADRAYKFNGISDYIDIGQFGDINDVSVSMWFRCDTSSQNARVMGSSTWYNQIFSLTLVFINGISQFSYLLSSQTGSPYELYGYVDNIPNDQAWHHFVFTRTGNSTAFFLDGNQHSITVVHGDFTGGVNTGRNYYLGAENCNDFPSCPYFDGVLDDIRIYNRALTETEIQALYQELPCHSNSLFVLSDTVCLDPRLHKVTLDLHNLDTLKAMIIPLHPEITCPGFTIDSVSFAGTRIENWESKTIVIGPDSIVLGLVANLGGGTSPLLPGEGAIAYIYYSINCDPAHTGETCYFTLDTTTIQPESQHLLFVDNHNYEFIPYFETGTTTVNLYRPGDANCNCEVNIADVAAMINYLFVFGPEPCLMDAGDANGDCNVNVADAAYLINYLFIGGPAPVCGCASNPSLANCCGGDESFAKTAGTAQVGLITSESAIEDNPLVEVAASFGTEVAGVQLEFSYDPQEIQSIIPELTDRTKHMKLFFGARNGILKIGIIDLSGENLIPAGEGALVKLSIAGSNPTSLEIQKAILVDRHAQSFEVNILPKEENQASTPKNYVLSQNIPNPFNPETEISYSLPDNCQVKLAIYNVKGQKVKTLVDKFENIGHKTVRWDGTDETGQKVASGIYFYRLEAGDFTQTRKMVLMK